MMLSVGVSEERPNILFIVADDMGYGDCGVYGCRDIPTPNLDALAREGIRFTGGYVTSPVCSPSRASLMTGRMTALAVAHLQPDRVKRMKEACQEGMRR